MTLTTKAKPATAKRMEAWSRILDAVGEQFEALERRAIADPLDPDLEDDARTFVRLTAALADFIGGAP